MFLCCCLAGGRGGHREVGVDFFFFNVSSHANLGRFSPVEANCGTVPIERVCCSWLSSEKRPRFLPGIILSYPNWDNSASLKIMISKK